MWERAIYAQADYDTFELCCWAQVCYSVLGHSRMGDTINAGQDPHLLLGSEILRYPYETCEHILRNPDSSHYKLVKDKRQVAKHCNFGFMGGLGVNAFIDLVYSMSGEKLDPLWARQLRDLWFQTWPESREYFNWINSLHGHCVQLFVDRVRSGATFCQSANTFFQGLAADIANQAGWLVTKACYTETGSILYGSRPVLFVHDEFILECPESIGQEVADELVRLMLLAAEPFLPNVKLGASSCLMRYWSKEAKPTFENGRMVPWPNGQPH
jgi:DNA polymerase I-like protein with 3'-5' exonuclease and polymerase domains